MRSPSLIRESRLMREQPQRKRYSAREQRERHAARMRAENIHVIRKRERALEYWRRKREARDTKGAAA